MDSIPSYEFHKIFQRVSYVIDLKGALTPEEIDRRLRWIQKGLEGYSEKARSKSGKRYYRKKARAIQRLRQNRFPERAIAEASFNPYGIVSLTLHYGRRKAQAMKLAFERSRFRAHFEH
jgi:hypothetical protein